jgi:hypothetical protein
MRFPTTSALLALLAFTASNVVSAQKYGVRFTGFSDDHCSQEVRNKVLLEG